MPIKSAFHRYFAELYEDTMSRIYRDARVRITISLSSGGDCLDCGAGRGHQFNILNEKIDLPRENYFGIEWDPKSVSLANKSRKLFFRKILQFNFKKQRLPV